MENVLLKFGLCLVVVVDDDSKFMSVFTQMCKALNIKIHRAAKRNHKAIGVERFHRFPNHSNTLVSHQRETHTCFVESSMIAAYAWNAMPIDGTDIVRSIPAIGRPLRFPMDIVIAALPTPVHDAAQATVR